MRRHPKGQPKPKKYPSFLRWSGRWDGSLTRKRYAEYRRRFLESTRSAYFRPDAPWTLRDRARWALWALGVWVRGLLGISRIKLAGH